MKKLDAKAYQEIRLWMYRNARQLELTIWRHAFENGSEEAVLSALAFYQNDDGGFGHALEADSWNPNSSPYTTLVAINILKGIRFTDQQHPIMQGILRFLESGTYCLENGWLFSIPSSNEYAHAPWWTYDSKANEVESIGVTAEIVSFLMRFADPDSKLHSNAMLLSERMINKLRIPGSYGDMGIGGFCVLSDTIRQCGLTDQFDYSFLSETVQKLVHDSIERDIARWVYYGVRPSNYINSPESLFYRDNEDIVRNELDYLIETRPENGVWDITWSWFENNDKYAKEFAISENWWKASKAIEKVSFLKSFGRLD